MTKKFGGGRIFDPPPTPWAPLSFRCPSKAASKADNGGSGNTGHWDPGHWGGGAGPFGCTLFLPRRVYIQCLQSSAVIPADHPRVPFLYPLLTGHAWTECRRVGSFGLCAWVGGPDPRGTLFWHPGSYSLLPGQPRAPLVCPRLQAMPGLSVLWSGPFGLCAGLTWGPTPGELFLAPWDSSSSCLKGALGRPLDPPGHEVRPPSWRSLGRSFTLQLASTTWSDSGP